MSTGKETVRQLWNELNGAFLTGRHKDAMNAFSQ